MCFEMRDNPSNAQGKRSTPMSISARLKSFLDETQIPYSVMTHTTAYTAQGAAATMQISGRELAKTVLLWAGEEMILAVLPAPNHVRLDKLAAAITPGRTATRFACGTTTLFVWRNQRSVRSLRKGDAKISRVSFIGFA
jgi:hypothetical protein